MKEYRVLTLIEWISLGRPEVVDKRSLSGMNGESCGFLLLCLINKNL